MKSWRAEILKHFQASYPALIIAADPDELLCDPTVLRGLREKGFELVEYQDPISFRYLFESLYRDALAKASLFLVVRTRKATFEQIPFDLLQNGFQLKLDVASLFPSLSSNILAGLDKEDFARLYEVYDQYQGTAGDSDTIEFLLHYVYGIYPETVKSKTELLRVLLSIHYHKRTIPLVLIDYLLNKWGAMSELTELPLKDLVREPGVFYGYLQREWEGFIGELVRRNQFLNETAPDNLTEMPSPFTDAEIRSLVDNLFAEGKLIPIKFVEPVTLPKWVEFGIEKDNFGQGRVRLLERIYYFSEKLESCLTYKDWMNLAFLYGEIMHKGIFLDDGRNDDLPLALKQLQMQADRLFYTWLAGNYPNLSNLPYLPQPVMLHHIPHFLASKLNGGPIALLVLDGMSMVQWAQIKEILGLEFDFEQNAVFSWIPTITTIARQAIFAGEMPVCFADSIRTTSKEAAHWQLFWEKRGIWKQYVEYLRIAGYPSDYGQYHRSLPKNKVRAIVIDLVDQLVHSALQGRRGLSEEIKVWLGTGFLPDMLRTLTQEGYQVFITSDHGNRECTGTGRILEGVLAHTKGERVRVYNSKLLRDQAAVKYGGIPWDNRGLPPNLHALLAPETGAFVAKDERIISHGSMSLEEVIVPFIKVMAKGRKEH